MQPRPKLEIKQLPKSPASVSGEAIYWKSFKFPFLHPHASPITHIDFNPVAPHNYAVTCSGQVELFDPNTNEIAHTITKFKSKAYSAKFRNDGKVIAAGTEEGTVRVFDAKTRSVLRDLQGHTSATHVTRFASNNVNIFSGSDDMIVRYWDLATAQSLNVFNGHSDYVRCGSVHPTSPNILVSGSYDHTLKIWDTRSQAATMTLNHQSPVEDLLIYPTGGILVSCGGDNVKVWDLLKGTMVTFLSNHQKTITCLALDSQRSRLFSGSLDQMVKIYSTQTYQVVHSAKYQAPILSLGVSPAQTHLIVGMADGMLSTRYRKPESVSTEGQSKGTVAASSESEEGKGLGALIQDFESQSISKKSRFQYEKPEVRVVIKTEEPSQPHLTSFEDSINTFRFQEALLLSLTEDPVVTVSVLNQLDIHSELISAISGFDDVGIVPVLAWIAQNITKPEFGTAVTAFYEHVLNLYSPVLPQSSLASKYMREINTVLKAEIALEDAMFETAGVLDLLFSQVR